MIASQIQRNNYLNLFIIDSDFILLDQTKIHICWAISENKSSTLKCCDIDV